MIHSNRRSGLTLFQLLLPLALLLMGFLLLPPAIAKARQAVARTQCDDNLRLIGLSIHAHNDQVGFLPPMAGDAPVKGAGFGTVFFFLLPYIHEDNLYKNSREFVDGKEQHNVWVKGDR